MAIPGRSAGPGSSARGSARRSLGLVLAGGGARGFAHAGVLRGLDAIGAAPDAVVGVSMGAVVGVTYALREDWYDALAEMDTSGFPGPYQLFAGEDASWSERARTVGAASRVIWDMIVGWGIGARSVEFGRSMLRDLTLDMRLEDARIPVAVGATDLTTGERVVLRSGSAAEAIYASSALAGIVPPLRRDGRVLCDGTYADSAPIDVARALGAAVVVAVDPGQDLTAGPIRSGVHALLRALDICHTQHDALRFGAADVVLKPCFSRSIDTLEFDARRECLAAGLRAVRASRRELENLAGASLRTRRLEPGSAEQLVGRSRSGVHCHPVRPARAGGQP